MHESCGPCGPFDLVESEEADSDASGLDRLESLLAEALVQAEAMPGANKPHKRWHLRTCWLAANQRAWVISYLKDALAELKEYKLMLAEKDDEPELASDIH